ncbi:MULTISPECIES: cupin domain-containing protein [unclassified Sphingomonas]|uniref:cupin domain-containing protein n=1 Tax=unclassified Sphingomonas TaxID=196159 RepID=UPI0021515125|nr:MULTISPECIES: cupin domain-containing protein [unclassified Sphingomonas]MCR5872155.1 cupin domain-containing protein [Sphingomonas sp. J344]UUX99532.1 cupin domain-containing protein [Sphingomonas sp. J315]
MTFADFLAPLPEGDFLDRHWDLRPVHIPATEARRIAPPIGWSDLNALLAQRAPWTPDRFKLMLNGRAVDPAHYLAEAPGKAPAGDPARIEHLLAMGASLVLDHLEDLLPPVRALADLLADRFAALVGANCYVSFQGVQAFASHYDTHEVFAIQCAGEKRWRIYAHRADMPLDPPQGDDAQAWIDAAKGPVLMDVTTRPGDLLYIPRGFFHDAIATDTQSLHLTFGVAPFSGRLLLELIQQTALADPAFRAWLPDARGEDGDALNAHLTDLGARLASLARSPALRDSIRLRQRKLATPAHPVALPARPALDFYARTGLPAQVSRDESGSWLATNGTRAPLGLLADAAEWMLARPAFSAQEVRAQFPHHPVAELDALVARIVRDRLAEPYRPRV